ncbi:hypothetical protein [Corynebacterium terpenotabidum]|uniref:Uncharacterized protein n=1 Tax=Corynebacterium terpenotabidum Y-11 TaxID=1200352 RepID=S4XDR5_9CORY|nr:hypothetical protein [Corynebacterium terpenotabidum]AGP29735.1 hypothetical protein A606_00400 [Corynebacterium terpenotabidum Y-11]
MNSASSSPSPDSDLSAVDTGAATDAASSRSWFPLISGILIAIIGLAFVVGGVVGWLAVKSELVDEHITVSEDADHFAGEQVDGPFSAYA